MQTTMIETHRAYIDPARLAGRGNRRLRDTLNDAAAYARVNPDALPVWRHNARAAWAALVAKYPEHETAELAAWVGVKPAALALATGE